MKRYIRYISASVNTDAIDKSLFDDTPFLPDTDVSYYNDFLNLKDLAYQQEAKNRTGEIVLMSPNEYFWECSQYGFPGGPVNVDHVIAGRRANSESINWLKSHLSNGGKFYLPYIDYAAHSQEGLHRMMVAGDTYGWDTKFPVLVVTAYDDEIERENQLFRDYIYFRDRDFGKICQQAEDDISDWYAPVPDNFEELLRSKVVEIANDYEDGYDIDVSIQIDEVDNHHRVFVSLDRYFDYDSSDRNEGEVLWLEDMYDVNGVRQRTQSTDDSDAIFDELYENAIKEAEEQGIDLDDYDSIMNLLLKN